MVTKMRRGTLTLLYHSRITAYLLLFSLFCLPAMLAAQEAPPETPAEAPSETPAEAAAPEVTEVISEQEANEKKRLELEIKTSTLSELAEWCKELGLGEGGGREELAQRIRSHYNLTKPEAAAEAKRVVVIESARTTEYFTLETVDEEYARLSGGVQMSLKEGETLHKIKAWEILYNRTRNIISATGGVEYVKEESGTKEMFKGDTIVLNLDTWVGSFLDTISERSVSSADTAYRFTGQVISKTDSDTTVLKRATVSNAKNSEPYWSLNATRIWLFPGSDWAVFNAVLKVGEIPVLYLPFFLYPADDVIFHPVIGTRTREGYFLQTTTYILGRPVADPSKQNSISKILGSNDGMEKKQQGLFLRSTGKKETAPDGRIFSLLLDAYTNMGFYTGLELKLPNASIFKNIDFSGGLGWTRTVVQHSAAYYSPLLLNVDTWESDWNSSYLFGLKVPFRYRFKLDISASGRYGSLQVLFPLYSDPFIDYDLFHNRSEQMNWVELLKGGIATDPATMTTTTIGSYQWNISLRPNIGTTRFSPYLSTLSINTISTFINFTPSRDISKDAGSSTDLFLRNSPARQFFVPDKWTVYTTSASIGGTLFSIGTTAPAPIEKKSQDLFDSLGTPVSPWGEEEKEEGKILGQSSTALVIEPPPLSQIWTLPKKNSLRFSMNYSFTPSSATELQYNKDVFTSGTNMAEDIKWLEYQSALTTFRTDGSTNFTLSEANNNFFSNTLSFSGSYQRQDHTYLSDDLTQTQKNQFKYSDYRSQQWNMYGNYNFTLNPFAGSGVWSGSNLQYSLSALIVRSLFDEKKYQAAIQAGNTEPDPEWEVKSIAWDRDYISTHRVSANINANIMNKTQSLSFYAVIPPLYRAYSVSATARAWVWESNANMIIQEDTDENKTAAQKAAETRYHYVEGYLFKPLYLTQTLSLPKSTSFRLYSVWDPELDKWTNLAADLRLGAFSVSFNALLMYKYYYDDAPGKQGWKQETSQTGEQKLYPRDFTLSWSTSYHPNALFQDLLKLTLSMRTNLMIDLQRYTYSKFTFNISLSLNITRFLDFSMGANSENAEIYRYMQDFPLFSDLRSKIDVGAGQETNVFIDLLNSFRLDNEELRRKSGFKLKSFSFSAVHHLGDWDASASVSFTPYLDNTNSNPSQWQYRFKTSFSFIVRWLPITEIETQIEYQNEKFQKKTSN